VATTQTDPQRVFQQYVGELNAPDHGDLEPLYADDYRYRGPASTGMATFDRAQRLAFWKGGDETFTDYKLEIRDTHACGDRLLAAYTCTGRFVGQDMGARGTGQTISFDGILVIRARDGQIVEETEQWDTLTMAQQMGLAPAP
jgi:steroid delta-isomerase-like uncharacterized protein